MMYDTSILYSNDSHTQNYPTLMSKIQEINTTIKVSVAWYFIVLDCQSPTEVEGYINVKYPN